MLGLALRRATYSATVSVNSVTNFTVSPALVAHKRVKVLLSLATVPSPPSVFCGSRNICVFVLIPIVWMHDCTSSCSYSWILISEACSDLCLIDWKEMQLIVGAFPVDNCYQFAPSSVPCAFAVS